MNEVNLQRGNRGTPTVYRYPGLPLNYSTGVVATGPGHRCSNWAIGVIIQATPTKFGVNTVR